MKRGALVLAIGAGAAAGYAGWARPHHLRWGSTRRERERVWVGDEFVPQPVAQATRAITIRAAAEQVWPWVAQVGQDRGGFYSYTPLENLFRAGMHNAPRIHSEWQERAVGDRVWLADPARYGGQAYVRIARWIPGRAIVLVSPHDFERIREGNLAEQGAWSFIVEPIDRRSCRLIARTLTGAGISLRSKLAHYLFWEPAHFLMERGMLLGIRKRAEEAIQ